MASRIIAQPNGLFARFNTDIDDFEELNMSREEAWNRLRSMVGREAADYKMAHAMVDPDRRLSEVIAAIREEYGPVTAMERMDQLSGTQVSANHP